MICKNCSTNYDDNAPYCPYCGAPNDMAHGSQQSQNEYYNPNAQQGGQYYYNGQPNTQQPNYQYQQQDMNCNPQQMNTEPTKEKIVAGLLAIGAPVMAVISLIEGILYLTKSDAEFYQTYVQNKKEWF